MTSIRPLDASSADELGTVALGMRRTLVEVLGEARGGSMYTHEWLARRVLFYVEVGVALVAEIDGGLAGHAMARVVDEGVGHFATVWVEPRARRRGVATALADAVEAWLAGEGARAVRYFTDEDNAKLLAMFEARGYAVTERHLEARMVALTKRVAPV